MLTSDLIKQRAADVGFDLCGIAPAASHPELRFLDEWLDRGHAGEMEYLRRTRARRADVRVVLPSARSVIVLGTLYNSDGPYSTEIADPGVAKIARYGWGDDYHDIVRRRTESLLGWMRTSCAEPFEARAYVDTGPVQERVYAQYAGLGWIGKNTCLINPHLGSWLFLSEIICSLALHPDPPALDQCATCELCIDACPTDAIVEPWVLDATRCLSYLTIEIKGSIPEPQRESLGSHVFGCDICQDVCPWNGASPSSTDSVWQPRPGLDRPRLATLWERSDDELRQLLHGTPLIRPGIRGVRRNVAVAIGNSGDAQLASVLEAQAEAEPVVAEHVVWARQRLSQGR